MPPSALNLTFHGVGATDRPLDAGEDRVWVSRDLFIAVLDAVAGRADVRITFDDGNASDLAHALPALLQRGLNATFFVVAGNLGSPGYLDREGVRELAAAGMRIGSHGMCHRMWRGLDDAQLHEELVDAKAVLQEVVEGPVTEAACPFGRYDRRVLRALRASGYRTVFTSDRGYARPDQWLQARNTIVADDRPDVVERIALGETGFNRLVRTAKQSAKRWR